MQSVIHHVLSEGLTEAEGSTSKTLTQFPAHGHSHRATCVPYQHGNPRASDPKKSDTEAQIGFIPRLRSHIPSFPQYSTGYLGQPLQCGRELHKHVNVRKRGSVGAIMEHWLPQSDKIILLIF